MVEVVEGIEVEDVGFARFVDGDPARPAGAVEEARGFGRRLAAWRLFAEAGDHPGAVGVEDAHPAVVTVEHVDVAGRLVDVHPETFGGVFEMRFAGVFGFARFQPQGRAAAFVGTFRFLDFPGLAEGQALAFGRIHRHPRDFEAVFPHRIQRAPRHPARPRAVDRHRADPAELDFFIGFELFFGQRRGGAGEVACTFVGGGLGHGGSEQSEAECRPHRAAKRPRPEPHPPLRFRFFFPLAHFA